jgi:DeoR/GlpR family transcriptional regulator of sugar metabolism
MDEAVVRTKRAMITSSRQSCLMINNRRFGHTALHVLADLTEFDTVLSDKPLPHDTLAELGDSKTVVRIAHKETTI